MQKSRHGSQLLLHPSLPINHLRSPNHSTPHILHGRHAASSSRSLQQRKPAHSSSSAKKILEGLDELEIPVDPSTYASLLELYSNSRSLEDGRIVHIHIVSHGNRPETHDPLQDLLLGMYCRCEAMEDALAFLHGMPVKPQAASLWNALLKMVAEQGEERSAVDIFEKMLLEGVLPDKVTYIALANASIGLLDEMRGIEIHARQMWHDSDVDVILGTSLVNLYAKYGLLEDSRRLFDFMPNKNVITWTTFISAYSQYSEKRKTMFQLFYQMQAEGHLPNRVTYVAIALSITKLREGKRIHAILSTNGYVCDVVARTAYADMYSRSGSLMHALEMLHESSEWNVVAWNACIAAFVRCDRIQEALQSYCDMQQHGILPDNVTFLTAIDACSNGLNMVRGKHVHSCIVAYSCYSDVTLGNALINMYEKCGRIHDASCIFNAILVKNIVSWNSMITAFAKHGHGKEALRLFAQMKQEGFEVDRVTLYGYFDACASENALSLGIQMHACICIAGCDTIRLDEFLGTTLINMYGKCSNLRYAQKVFDEISQCSNLITWNALIASYANLGKIEKVHLLFDRMLWEGMAPAEATFVGMLNAFAEPAALAAGGHVHCIILSCGYGSDVIVGNALINMYGKCGDLGFAWTTFDKMIERDAISWTSIIGVHGEHGQGRKALQLFDEMLNFFEPDEIAFLNVLTACNRAGLADDGKYWFETMSTKYGIVPNPTHYCCMIDLLGRSGNLEEAESLMKQMPFPPCYTAWMAFLGACRHKLDVKRAQVAANHLFGSYPQNHQPYVLLANLYSAAGMVKDASCLLRVMQKASLQRNEKEEGRL